MNKVKIVTGHLLLTITLALLAGNACSEGTLGAALTGGKVSLAMRYRFEHVGEDNANKNAEASTLRTALGYTTGNFNGLGAMLEFENISAIGTARYNSGVNGLTRYSKVGDPTGSEVNQAYLSFKGLPETVMQLGRQRITLDDMRFVGNSSSRQNEQTFDGFEAINKTLPDTQFTYAFLTNADRSTGHDSSTGDLRMKTHLVNIAYSGLGLGTLTGYGYFLDIDNQTLLGAASASAKTLGLRFTGTHALNSDMGLLYAAEYARQSDYADNPRSYGLNYLLGELGFAVGKFSAKYGYENLGSDGTHSVQVPLGTRHSRDGWDDMFSPATPTNGLIDRYLTVVDQLFNLDEIMVYHDFRADQGGAKYGTEWDAMISRTWQKRYMLGLKYAAYHADTYAVNTNKAWFIGEVKF
ncbi:MAG: alginate export family protein [Gammaproteobacteria bacterium]